MEILQGAKAVNELCFYKDNYDPKTDGWELLNAFMDSSESYYDNMSWDNAKNGTWIKESNGLIFKKKWHMIIQGLL